MDVQNNNTVLDIATGLAAGSKKWKPEQVSWGELTKRLSEPKITDETLQEFLSMSREDQQAVKDVGGFVGGYLRGARRSPANLVHRQLLTLDIDFAGRYFWDDFTLMFDCAAFLHGTHKHSEDNPRLRLVIPLDRPVSPDEYVAVSRRVAGDLGIELFDKTTFQPTRLMFWPSIPVDVEYYTEEQVGEWLSADGVLSRYADWRDSTLWPVAGSEFAEAKDAAAKQADPDEKKGVVGAFCRTYSISEAMADLLADKYEEVHPGRYTYTEGSTAGGVVVYEDKWAYSHHGTDPISGKLCNAFDLVRLNKFGHLDEGSRASGKNAPSFKAMEDLASASQKVRKTIAEEILSSAVYDFAEPTEEKRPDTAERCDDTEWAAELEIDAKGRYLSNSTNINLIISNDKNLAGKFVQNVFDGKRYVTGGVPWRGVPKPEPLKNVDYSGVRNYIESVYRISGAAKIDDALAVEIERSSYHPVRDYLNAVTWDGVPRVDTMLIDYMGAEDSLYTREASRKTLAGGVARIFNPGCKFDTVLTFVGAEGIGKSMLPRKLGGDWFSDTFSHINGKESFEQLQGHWIVEIAELAGFRKAEVVAVKQYLTKQEDTYRPAYGRVVETYPRQCIFFATTNEDEFLKGSTGNRRFIPVKVAIEKASLSVFDLGRETVAQLWAEAVHIYRAGETLYLSSEAEAEAKTAQKSHTEHDVRAGVVQEYLDAKLPNNWQELDVYARRDYVRAPAAEGCTRKYVCAAEVWCECFGRDRSDMDRYKTRELNDILKSLPDWEQVNSTKKFTGYGTQKYYKRK